SLLIIMFTHFEMKKQRSHSYLPKVFFETASFYLQQTEDILPFFYVSHEKHDNNEELNIFPNDCHIDLVNLGLGPALDIEIEFKPDKKKIMEQIKTRVPESIAGDGTLKIMTDNG
ncbi:hypothetical protein, partial [Oceanispirochaeta sp.]|uniref:hypothetical protein n=1 Tax=Oceanispirochaeta sp. TaxID=2035350 RepID=UPI002639BA6F